MSMDASTFELENVLLLTDLKLMLKLEAKVEKPELRKIRGSSSID